METGGTSTIFRWLICSINQLIESDYSTLLDEWLIVETTRLSTKFCSNCSSNAKVRFFSLRFQVLGEVQILARWLCTLVLTSIKLLCSVVGWTGNGNRFSEIENVHTIEKRKLSKRRNNQHKTAIFKVYLNFPDPFENFSSFGSFFGFVSSDSYPYRAPTTRSPHWFASERPFSHEGGDFFSPFFSFWCILITILGF